MQKRYDRLLVMARKVRGLQREYFKHKASSDLEKAKRAERELDQFLAAEIEAKASPQQKLF